MSAWDALPTPNVSQLQDVLLSTGSLEEFLDEVTAQAAGSTGDGQLSCGLTVHTHEKRPYTVSSSDGFAAALDEIQYHAGEGPCLQALRTGEVVDFAELTGETRWPTFVAQATDTGLHASLSMPMRTAELTVGALNLYRRAGRFTTTDRQRAEAFAERATGAVVLAVRLSEQQRISADLQAALVSRSTIDQALGVLMAQQHCNADEAFVLLRRASQRSNIKLHEIASRIITEVSGQEPTTPGPVD
jgi:GAF domain-containing protein